MKKLNDFKYLAGTVNSVNIAGLHVVRCRQIV